MNKVVENLLSASKGNKKSIENLQFLQGVDIGGENPLVLSDNRHDCIIDREKKDVVSPKEKKVTFVDSEKKDGVVISPKEKKLSFVDSVNNSEKKDNPLDRVKKEEKNFRNSDDRPDYYKAFEFTCVNNFDKDE